MLIKFALSSKFLSKNFQNKNYNITTIKLDKNLYSFNIIKKLAQKF